MLGVSQEICDNIHIIFEETKDQRERFVKIAGEMHASKLFADNTKAADKLLTDQAVQPNV